MEAVDITKYVDMAWRRRWWIIIPFLISILVGLAYALNAPKVYETRTLILVQPQRVPSDFVRSIVSMEIGERLKTITQQVTSRTNLESIIKEYQLYGGSGMLLDAKVETLRKRIKINVGRGGRGTNSFDVSLRGEDPRKIMEVTNALASNFISENLKIRESQALGTSGFLSDELESVKRRLEKKESLLREYGHKYMGAMPNHLQTNLDMLGRLQMQSEQLSNNLRDAENRRLIIQKQIAESERMERQMAEDGESSVQFDPTRPSGDPASEDLESLRKRLALLETRYTDMHPDLIRLKKMIAKVEGKKAGLEVEDSQPGQGATDPDDEMPDLSSMTEFLRLQLEQVMGEMKNIKAEIRKVRSKMDGYQKRVEETPKREQELLILTRDYGNLKGLYDSMLNRKLEAEIAVSMEKKQKGEQFRVVDPAKLPSRPVEPDMKTIILLTMALGIGLGCGLAYLMEFMDTSYKQPEDVEKDLHVPILVSFPILYTEGEMKRIKRRKIIAFASVSVGFVMSVIGILIASRGFDGVMNLMKNVLGKG